MLVVDETGFLKQGKASRGVARQYTGSAGKITNRQIGVFAACASRHGHAFLDRALYLPKGWTDDPTRRAAARIPDTVGFATEPRIALGMVERAIAAGVPFAWVAADAVYGVGAVEMALRRAGKDYVLGVTGAHHVHSWGALPPSRAPPRGLQRTSPRRRGAASRRARARRGRGCTTGPTSNSPTSERTSTSRAPRASGRAAC